MHVVVTIMDIGYVAKAQTEKHSTETMLFNSFISDPKVI
jgi:hypothetical protein